MKKQEFATFTATATGGNIDPIPVIKKTWKQWFVSEILPFYLILAIVQGSLQFLVWIIQAIIWTVSKLF